MPPQTAPEPLRRIMATTRRAHAAVGLPGVSWIAEYEELERLMSRHPAFASLLMPRVTRTAPRRATYGGWSIPGRPSPP